MQKHEFIRTKDGLLLEAAVFLPEASSQGVVVVGGSAQETQLAYRPLAEFFSRNGFAVITFDYRGTGNAASGQLAGFAATLRQWATLDLDAVVQWARHRFKGQEILFFGHGMGGQLAGLVPSSQYFDRMILVNSALTCWRLMPLRRKIQLTCLSLLRSVTTRLLGYFPGKKLGFLQDLPTGVMAEYSSWCDQPNGLFDFFPDGNYRKIQCPLLAVSFEDDWLSPTVALEALLRHFSGAEIERWRLPGNGRLGHSGFLRPEMEGGVWQHLLGWMLAAATSPAKKNSIRVNGNSQ